MLVLAGLIGCPGPPSTPPVPTPEPEETGDTAVPVATADTGEALVEPHSVEVRDLASSGRTGFTVSIAAADDEIWIAVEHATWALGRADVDLIRWDGTALAAKVVSESRLTPLTGHYPAILVDDGDATVQVVAKQNVLQTRPQLELITQSRTDLAAPVSRVRVDPPGLGLRFGRAHVDRDPVLATDHLCVTAYDDEPEQDVFVKTRAGAEAWNTRPLEAVADAAGVQDHCDFGFGSDGRRLSVWHSEPDGDAIQARMDRLGPDGWEVGRPFDLGFPPGHEGANFPAVAVEGDHYAVAAASSTNRDELLLWECTGECLDEEPWRASVIDPPGPRHRQPKLVLVDGNAFLMWETEDDPGPWVYFGARCEGSGTWDVHGPVERPPGYTDGAEVFGSIPGAAARTFLHRDGVLHAALLVQPDGSARWNAAWWSASVRAFCP
ncbi:MAG: hypothetical protein H6737_30070 [Alphaproteobacteria bacterium]|nr:hypothetical protein [Alphaproteobacteria bacterium]